MSIACIIAVVGFVIVFSLAFSGRKCDEIMGEDHAEVRYNETQELIDEIKEGNNG